LTPYLLRL
jgi:carbamoyl-phosphate synthase/aspartate carbamoyltransferase